MLLSHPALICLFLLVTSCTKDGGIRPRVLQLQSDALASTVVVAQESLPFPSGRSALWCATSQLAWDALPRRAPGAPLELGPPADAALVERLNRGPFPAGALDPASFVALGGFDDEGILEAIRRQVAERFDDAPHLPELPAGAPWGAIGYARLHKSVPFAHAFERADRPLRFEGGTRDLASFRIPENAPFEVQAEVRDQVSVLFQRWVDVADGAQRFEGAVSIPSKDGGDRLVLALLPRAADLRATWDSVARAASSAPPQPLPYKAEFQVPLVHFELRHRFTELEGGTADVGRSEPATLVTFLQDLHFQLTETGATLRAESSAFAVGAAVAAEPPPRFVFDSPFLLALVEEGSETPYFLWWVANDELLAGFVQ